MSSIYEPLKLSYADWEKLEACSSQEETESFKAVRIEKRDKELTFVFPGDHKTIDLVRKRLKEHKNVG